MYTTAGVSRGCAKIAAALAAPERKQTGAVRMLRRVPYAQLEDALPMVELKQCLPAVHLPSLVSTFNFLFSTGGTPQQSKPLSSAEAASEG